MENNEIVKQDENKDLDEQPIIIDNVVNDQLTDKELDEVKNDESNVNWDELPTPPESPTLGEAHNYVATAVQTEKLAQSIMDDKVKEQLKPAEQVLKEANQKLKKDKDVMDQLLEAVNSLVKIAKKEPKKAEAIKKFIDDVKLTINNHTSISQEIKFIDHLNTKYEVIETEQQYMDEHETFADIARRGLNPVVSTDAPVYGVARRMEPKNITIARMKNSIDVATNELNARKKDYNDYIAKLEAEAKNNQPQPKAEPKGEPK